MQRIDHGVRCLEDQALVERLVDEPIPLTVCPLYHVKLRVFKTLRDHNPKRLLDAGLCVTVNSDDAACFGAYVGEDYLPVQATPDLDADAIIGLAKKGFVARFPSDDEKRRYAAEIDQLA